MKALRWIAGSVSGLFFLCGLVPFLLFGHVNSGNLALLLFGLTGLLLAAFWRKCGGLRLLRLLRGLIAGVWLLCFLTGLVLSGFMFYYAYGRMPGQAPERVTVVVLGCEILGEQPGRHLRARLDAAIAYLRAHPECPVVVSGGKGSDEICPEAFVMQQYLLKNGIDAERIYAEDRSENTAQNFAFTKELMEAEGLPETVLAATDNFHEMRACLYAKRNGLRAYALPSRPADAAVCVTFPEFWVREILGLLHFTLLER